MLQSAIIVTCNSVWRYCAVNLMILALTLAGAVVLGIAPAISAGYWAMSRPELPLDQLARGMMREWRREFVRSNLFALPLGLAIWGASLTPIAELIPFPYRAIILVLVGETTVAALFALSIACASIRESFANTCMIMMMRPFRLLCVTLSLPALALIAFWQPLLVLYGLFSLHAAIAVWLLGSMRDPARRPLAVPSHIVEAKS